MGKKFELTEETKERNGRTLYRIRALRNFGDVKKGQLGGWVEREENLSHEGNAWVYDEAEVHDWATVCGNATMHNWTILCGSAALCDRATMRDWATASGNALICDDAIVYWAASIHDETIVCGRAKVGDRVTIHGRVRIGRNTALYGNMEIRGNGQIVNERRTQPRPSKMSRYQRNKRDGKT